MIFLCQTVKSQVTLDFVFALQEAQRYYEWRGDPFSIIYSDTPDKGSGYIPIGTIEFVKSYIEKYQPLHLEALKPLNVPKSLFVWAGRDIQNIEGRESIKFSPGTSVFRKSITTIKDKTNGYIEYKDSSDVYGYQISSIIPNIKSEWRIFVYHKNPLQACFYSGDPMCFPDSSSIIEMIRDYYDSPVSYTLDVYIDDFGTHILECHRFFSCGLYGFSDPQVLPYMFSQGWFEMMKL